MTGNDPDISVIVPVFNGAAFIAEAIESILAQSYRSLEILVIDDGSSDDTVGIVKTFGDTVQYHYQTNSGTSVARNHGVRCAKADFLAFLDADDLWAANKIHRQVEAFRLNPALDLAWGHVVEFSGEKPGAGANDQSIPGHHPGTMLIRRAAFERIGEFSEVYQQAEVVEWMTRVVQSQVKQLMLPETLMYRRIHGANKGKANPSADKQYLQVLKKHLERKRAR